MFEGISSTRRSFLLGLAACLLAPAEGLAQAGFRRRQMRRQERRERRQELRQRRRETLNRPAGRGDPDTVRDAVRRGEIQPLRSLMRYFEQRTGAEIIDVEYRYLRGQHLYGFKVRTPAGRLRWAVINAATREIMTRDEARQRYGG